MPADSERAVGFCSFVTLSEATGALPCWRACFFLRARLRRFDILPPGFPSADLASVFCVSAIAGFWPRASAPPGDLPRLRRRARLRWLWEPLFSASERPESGAFAALPTSGTACLRDLRLPFSDGFRACWLPVCPPDAPCCAVAAGRSSGFFKVFILMAPREPLKDASKALQFLRCP